MKESTELAEAAKRKGGDDWIASEIVVSSFGDKVPSSLNQMIWAESTGPQAVPQWRAYCSGGQKYDTFDDALI